MIRSITSSICARIAPPYRRHFICARIAPPYTRALAPPPRPSIHRAPIGSRPWRPIHRSVVTSIGTASGPALIQPGTPLAPPLHRNPCTASTAITFNLARDGRLALDVRTTGIADGVGSWVDYFVDAGQYVTESHVSCSNWSARRAKMSLLIFPGYKKADRNSSTACIIALTDQVEELASLIKDNLYSKHLVLSTEETLVGILQNQYHNSDDDSDEDDTVAAYCRTNRNIIELQPASSYQRLLLHRLADIYGFVHESVGEGEDRHLVLQRCPETAIPPVLVSDVLWEYDNKDTSTSVVVNMKDIDPKAWKEDAQENISAESSHLKNDSDLKALQQSVALPALSLKEREVAYQAARERIFSTHDAIGKDTTAVKPRHVPAVAQRMIAHALGKKVESPTETAAVMNGKGKEPAESSRNRNKLTLGTTGSKGDSRYVENGRRRLHTGNPSKQNWRTSSSRAANSVSPEELKREQVGAAKRMFAHALRLPGVEGSDAAVRNGKRSS